MSEKYLSESAKLDITNTKLSRQLFYPITIAEFIEKIVRLQPKLEIASGNHLVQAIPASGDLIYFHMPDDDTANHILQGADFSIKFRHDGTIIYSEAGSNFRTKYDLAKGAFTRYDRSRPGIPDQTLPRHAKNIFLNTILDAQRTITELTGLSAST